MKIQHAIVLLLVATIYACTHFGTTPPVSGNDTPGCFCYDSTNCNNLCATLPLVAKLSFGSAGYFTSLSPSEQVPLDQFSWQSFVALNWPADSSGKALPGPITDHTKANRVWEYYPDPAQVFKGSVAAPLLLYFDKASVSGNKFLYMDSKSPKAVDPLGHFIEADGYPLIDRNKNFVLYEVKINPDEAAFIQNNGLSAVKGIYDYYMAHDKKFELPYSNPNTNVVGAMEIKTAWRILDPAKGDDPTRYYTRMANIYIPASNSRSGKELLIQNVQVGLVGMHIIRQISQANGVPQSQRLIWSTFEHVDNAPYVTDGGFTKQWSFFNYFLADTPVNTPPAHVKGDGTEYKWDTVAPYAASYPFPSQIKRIMPAAFSCTDSLNTIWQAKLQGSVWVNYQLIGTQWFVAGEAGATNTPVIMANTTLESYLQGSASCISCHQGAAVAYINGKDTTIIPTDFSFLFGMAK